MRLLMRVCGCKARIARLHAFSVKLTLIVKTVEPNQNDVSVSGSNSRS